MRDGLLSALEAQRLSAWEAYINADVEARLTAALLRHEGRARRLELRIQTLLASEVIPALEAQLASVEGRRRLEITHNAQVQGRNADIVMTFSAPVSVGVVTLESEPLEIEGEGAVWTARFDPRDFADGEARLVVEAEHAAVAGRRLDDPATIAVWNPVASVMTGYEMIADAHHAFRLDPPAGAAFALILDTSGSMAPAEGADPATSRFAQAQAALRDLLNSGQIRQGDEAALFTFDGGCGAVQAAPFTTELSEVAAAVDAAAFNGSTPLAASILTAAESLSARNVERGVVIAVTDGQEACGGSVSQAVAEAGARIDQVRQRRIP